MNRRQRDLRRLARAFGCRLARRSRHWALYAPSGELLAIAAASPGAHDLHILAGELRRAGRFETRRASRPGNRRPRAGMHGGLTMTPEEIRNMRAAVEAGRQRTPRGWPSSA